jgi:hypothetical protein
MSSLSDGRSQQQAVNNQRQEIVVQQAVVHEAPRVENFFADPFASMYQTRLPAKTLAWSDLVRSPDKDASSNAAVDSLKKPSD